MYGCIHACIRLFICLSNVYISIDFPLNRWEAAQIPKVKVVRLNSSKLTTEQTAYMPSIPEIPKCPPNLLPSKDWESAFLADFSELRQVSCVY